MGQTKGVYRHGVALVGYHGNGHGRCELGPAAPRLAVLEVPDDVLRHVYGRHARTRPRWKLRVERALQHLQLKLAPAPIIANGVSVSPTMTKL